MKMSSPFCRALCFAALLLLHLPAVAFLARDVRPALPPPPPLDLVFEPPASVAAPAPIAAPQPPPSAPVRPAPALDEAAEPAEPAEPAAADIGVTTDARVATDAGTVTDAAPEIRSRQRSTHEDYVQTALRLLEQNKVYPLAARKRGLEGDVAVRFTVSDDGTPGDLTVSGAHAYLSQAAKESVRRAGTFPLPEGFVVEVVIRYRLEE